MKSHTPTMPQRTMWLLGLVGPLLASLVVLATPAAQAGPIHANHGRLGTPVTFAALQSDLISGWQRVFRGTPPAAAPVRVHGGAWQVEPAPNPAHQENGVLLDVSCISTTDCVAVGDEVNASNRTVPLAEAWNGTAWTIEPAPSPAGAGMAALQSVSCTAASACTAAGQYVVHGQHLPLIETWNGTAWTIQTAAVPSGAAQSVLFEVSCTAASACTAVGQWADPNGVFFPLAERWNGTAWTVEDTPTVARPGDSSGLDSVSCSSAADCTAVGATETSTKFFSVMAERWNGSRWRTTGAPSPAHSSEDAFTSVSCTAPGACVATGYYQPGVVTGGLAERWNGTGWTIMRTPAPSVGLDYDLNGISCTSPRACTAAGQDFSGLGEPLALVWNGTTWRLATLPHVTGVLAGFSAVSCTAANVCAAAGTVGVFVADTLAESQSGAAWTRQTTPDGVAADQSSFSAVSCPSATACVAVGAGAYRNARSLLVTAGIGESWNGTEWNLEQVPVPANGPDFALNGVSCRSPAACIAVGDAGTSKKLTPVAEERNGVSWAALPAPVPAGTASSTLGSVSCTSATSCVAVGEKLRLSRADLQKAIAETWDGTKWTLQTIPEPAKATSTVLSSVSCVSASDCTAVGRYFIGVTFEALLAEHWNGTTWTIQPTPALPATGLFTGVSCTSSTACVAVGWDGNGTRGPDPFAETWNGTTWTVKSLPLPAGTRETQLTGVSCVSATDCTAVGFSKVSYTRPQKAMAETWNGTNWTAANTPNPPFSSGSGLSGVSCLPAGGCTAVGDYGTTTGASLATLAIAN